MPWISCSGVTGHVMLLILLSLLQFSYFSNKSMICQCLEEDPKCWSSLASFRLWPKSTWHVLLNCTQPVPGEIRNFHWHLHVVHSLPESQDYIIICSENSCQRTYHTLNSYSRNLSREHSSGGANCLTRL